MSQSELLQKYSAYCVQNPLHFTEEQLLRIKNDITRPRSGVVCDEYVEFILWKNGLKSRQEYFADYIERLFPPTKYGTLLEAGCGRTARLSRLLADRGYRMAAIDPCLEKSGTAEAVLLMKERFLFGKTDLSPYDAVVAQEPCDATEHIIRACLAEKKSFCISLCGSPHPLMDGRTPETVYEWYEYLEELAGEHGIVLTPRLIPGYRTAVMIGIFAQTRS